MRRAGVVTLAALTGLTAGCQLFGADDDAAEAGDEEMEFLGAMFEENRRLVEELVDVQHRLILDCVEAQGHTVHDQYEFVMWQFQNLQVPDPDDGPLTWLMDREIAAEWGFGIWTSTSGMYGSDEHQEFEALALDDVTTFAETDNSDFEALTDREKFDWYVAYYGRDRAMSDQGWLLDEEFDLDLEATGGLIGTVEPGGCMGEVTEAIGLTPEFVPQPDFGEDIGTWSTFPLPPGIQAVSSGDLDEQVREERTRDEDFLACLDDAGWGRWEFNSAGDLNVRHFVDVAYMPPEVEVEYGAPELYTEGVPEPPSDVPADAESRRTWEIGFALDLWDCVDETGLLEDAERAWTSVYGDHFLELEEESYAWQEDMRELIDRAQELLTG